MKPKAITITVVFDAMSGNYGETVGNVSELKKISKKGELYSFISRQALRYELWKFLKEQFGIDTLEYWSSKPELAQAVKEELKRAGFSEELPPPEILHAEQEVVQFHPSVNALNCVEADLFGYMKTQQGENAATRSAVVRLSPAISLEPMLLDTEFGTNKNFADRKGVNPNPFQFEHHSSLYTYTVTVDLDRLGCEFDRSGRKVAELPKEEKLRRIEMVLDAIPFLVREVKGRTENLSPLFAIGGVYPVKNPFFMGRINVNYNRNIDRYSINTDVLNSVFDLSFRGEPVGKYTHCGYVEGFWENDFKEELRLDEGNFVGNISGFFNKLKEQVMEGID